jgi:hypothetical protein
MNAKLVVALVVTVVVVGAVGGYLGISQGSQTPVQTQIQHQVKNDNPRAKSSAMKTTIRAFLRSQPLAVVVSTSQELLARDTANSCGTVLASLAQEGSPAQMRALADGLPDSLAAELTQSVITAEMQALDSCHKDGSASATSIVTLHRALVALNTRLMEDGLK